MEFNIEKGIKRTLVRDRDNQIENSLPLKQMVSGDSILVPIDFLKPGTLRERLSRYSKRSGEKYHTQLMDGGVRIWRA